MKSHSLRKGTWDSVGFLDRTGMKSFAPVNEKEFESAELFIFGGLSLIMAVLKLAAFSAGRGGGYFCPLRSRSPGQLVFASRQAFEERG